MKKQSMTVTAMIRLELSYLGGLMDFFISESAHPLHSLLGRDGKRTSTP